jgi:hypothetical protein
MNLMKVINSNECKNEIKANKMVKTRNFWKNVSVQITTLIQKSYFQATLHIF